MAIQQNSFGPPISSTRITGIEDESNVQKTIIASGLVDREGNDKLLYSKFDRIGCADPYHGFSGAKEYVFFTKPDLHLYDSPTKTNPEFAEVPFLTDMVKRYNYAAKCLQSSEKWTISALNGPFINILTNCANSPIEVPALQARDIEGATNMYGTKLMYRGSSIGQDENLDVGIEFEDNKYLEVYGIFKIWDEYEKQKQLGYITPGKKSYIWNRIAHDLNSIFKIVVAEDGESILYFAKYIGCYPKNVPADIFSDLSNVAGNITFNIQFHANFFEDEDTMILSDFNTLVSPYMNGKETIKPYDADIGMSSGDWASIPYITVGDSSLYPDSVSKFKLKWLK